jgi:Fe-S cluster biogenesis protein NfuA
MAGPDARRTGERVEALLAELGSQAGPQVAATAEELVTCLVELYGAGLAGIVAVLREDPDAGPRLMDQLVADPLVESLLLLHDLHPVPVAERVRRAVDEAIPRLGAHAGPVEFLGLDDQGVVRLRLELGGHGCSSSSAAVREAISEAVAAAAPEAADVDVEVVTPAPELPLLQITRRRAPQPPAAQPPAAQLPTAQPAAAQLPTVGWGAR